MTVQEINELFSILESKESEEETDITKLKEQNKKLKNLCIVLNDIFENNPDGIYITDGNAVGARANKGFERLSGMSLDEWMGKDHHQLEKEGILSISASVRALKEHEVITVLQEYSPSKAVVMNTCYPVFDEQNQPVMTVASIRDLTELNQLKEKLAEEKALRNKIERELEDLKSKVVDDSEMIVHDKHMVDLLYMANKVAKVDSTVLITGETGVGKEEVARYIHQKSPRADEPFIVINCGAIPANLVESELFGYEKGAFTGASSSGKAGLLEVANNGTLFLDEIGELPLNVQVKLLRAIQQKVITRIGGTKNISLNIRIISATNRDLKEMISKNQFREDLYYRLSVIPLEIPPLRMRMNDIIPLADKFLKDLNEMYGYNKSFSSAIYRAICDYQWPGNVRELKNLVERAVVTSENDLITIEDFPIHVSRISTSDEKVCLKEVLEKIEYGYIVEAYEKFQSVRKAAEHIGMSMPTYVRKKKEYADKYGI